MHSLTKQILERVFAGGRNAEDPLLRSLLAATADGEGRLLRLSARRLVMQLKLDGRTWLFKVDSPQRSFERLRGRLRPPSLLREADCLRQLGLKYPALPVDVFAEQLDAATGLLARPWIDGRRGDAWLPADALAVGTGLARLHEIGWSDPDISPADLLLDAANQLLPLDLGHAHLFEGRPSPTKVRIRDLQRLLGGWGETQRATLGPAIIEVYGNLLSCPAAAEMMAAAKRWRHEILRRQSRRCLRRTRDFQPTTDGCERVENLPAGQAWRFEVDDQPHAKRAFRLLYELELLELPALRVLRFGKSATHAFIEVAVPLDSQAVDADRIVIDLCLSTLRNAGFDVKNHTAAMFRINAEGDALLADASNLQRL